MMRHEVNELSNLTALPFTLAGNLGYVVTGDDFEITVSTGEHAIDRVMIRDLTIEDDVTFFRADPMTVEGVAAAVLDGLSIARSMRPTH